MNVPLWQALLVGGGFTTVAAAFTAIGARMRDKETNKIALKTLENATDAQENLTRDKLEARADILHKEQVEFLRELIKTEKERGDKEKERADHAEEALRDEIAKHAVSPPIVEPAPQLQRIGTHIELEP